MAMSLSAGKVAHQLKRLSFADIRIKHHLREAQGHGGITYQAYRTTPLKSPCRVFSKGFWSILCANSADLAIKEQKGMRPYPHRERKVQDSPIMGISRADWYNQWYISAILEEIF